MKFGTEIVLLSLFAFAALVAAGFGADEPFRQHMWILFFVVAGFTTILLRNTEFRPAAPIDPSAYMDGPIRYGAIATVFWGVVGMLVGGGIGAHKTDMWEAVPSSRWHVSTLPTGPGRFAFALSLRF